MAKRHVTLQTPDTLCKTGYACILTFFETTTIRFNFKKLEKDTSKRDMFWKPRVNTDNKRGRMLTRKSNIPYHLILYYLLVAY